MRIGPVPWLWIGALVAACSGGTADPGPAPPASPLLTVGEGAYWRGEIDSARALFEIALAEARAAADPATEASALTWLGLAAWRLGDYEAARRLGEAGLELKLELGLRDRLFRSYNALGLLAWNESRYFEALDRLGRAEALARASGDSVELVKVWTNLGLVHSELGDFAAARRHFEAALPLARATGEFEGRVLTNLGMLAVSGGDPVTGIHHLQVGLARLRADGDPTGEQNVLGQLGAAYAAIGEPGVAIAYLDSALIQSRALGLRQEEASNLEQLAELHRGAGDHRRALRLYSEAKAVNEALGLADETGMDLRGEAEIHALLGNVDAARLRAERALAIHREVGSKMEELADLLLLAELAQRAGDRAGATRWLETARRLASTLDARRARVATVLAEARIADRDADPETVLRAVSAGMDDIAALGREPAAEALALTARAHARRGDLQAAAAAGREALRAVERIHGSYASGALATAYLADRERVHRDLVDVLLALGRVEEAFEVADAARGRALAEHVAAARSGRHASARELLEEERLLLERIDELTLLVEEAEEAGETADYASELEQLHGELGRARDAYESLHVRATESRGARLAASGAPKVVDVRRVLDPDEALVEFLVGPEAVHVFVATRDGVEARRVEVARDNLASRVRLARDLAGRAGTPSETIEPVLTGLHDLLLAPLFETRALRGKRALVIVPHGELAYVPFAALRDRARGRYVVEDFSLLHLPAASILPGLRRDRAAARRGSGTAVFAPFVDELPGSVREAEELRRVLPATRVSNGRQASEPAFRRALGEAQIVHAATHGVFNAANPLFSRIELARGNHGHAGDDGRLEIHELLSVPVSATLVFLSGCETALGPARATSFGRGEDYATLARAFLFAGAANVVATLWRVEDAGAAAFARVFYGSFEEHRAGDAWSLADALARAQREMIADARYRAPYYWAGYRISGSGRMENAAAFHAARRTSSSASCARPGDTVRCRKWIGHPPSPRGES